MLPTVMFLFTNLLQNELTNQYEVLETFCNKLKKEVCNVIKSFFEVIVNFTSSSSLTKFQRNGKNLLKNANFFIFFWKKLFCYFLSLL